MTHFTRMLPLLFLLPALAGAHGLDFGRLGMQLQGDRLTLVATPAASALQAFDVDRDGRLSVQELQIQRAAIAAALDAMLQLRDQQGRAPELTFSDVLVPTFDKSRPPVAATHVKIIRKYRFAAPPSVLQLDTDLAARTRQALTVLFKADRHPLQSEVLAPDRHTLALALAAPGFVQTLRQWLPIGIGHILTGTDHLLFLFLLVWGAARLREAGLWLTAFTLGHSLTLALVWWRILLFPAWAEAAIAASIVVTGLLALYRHFRPVMAGASGWSGQMLLAGGFGLVHGMGFAGALAGTVLETAQRWPTLIGFNLGIECGQLLFVLLLWPLLQWLRRQQARLLAPGVLACATGLGCLWLIQRL